LLQTCNYRCAYCFLSPESLGSKLRVHAQPDEWERAFRATGLTWLLHITGGEPTIYPYFVELCARLAESHYLSLNSNLSNGSIRDFAEWVPPERVSFINAALHPEDRTRRHGLSTFLDYLAGLRQRDFPVFVSVAATPEALAAFDSYVEMLRPVGLMPVPKVLRGRHAGRVYPAGYTELDRARFRHFSEAARESYRWLIADRAEPPSINPFDHEDEDVLRRRPSFVGQPCSAGHRFVSIDDNGTVHRCADDPLGNLLEGTMALRPGPTPCDTAYCFYWCRKYTAMARSAPGATGERASSFDFAQDDAR
jgi:MoaA/NifB/PqqE/SkfB family radical SAM enzyme